MRIARKSGRGAPGFSLIQIMVALAISSVLLLGVGQIFISSKQAYRTNEALSRVQENGRFADNFLGFDSRMAGFSGCERLEAIKINNIVAPSKFPDADADALTSALSFSFNDSIRGFEVSAGTALPAELSDLGLTSGAGPAQVLPDTDAVLLRGGSACDGGRVTEPTKLATKPANANVKVADAAACGFEQDDILLITDCRDADMFAVTNNPQNSSKKASDTVTHAKKRNLDNRLSKEYDEDATVLKLKTTVYYIGNNAQGERALYRRVLRNGSMRSEELVEGIEDLALDYGVDTSGDGQVDDYEDAPEVGDWRDVVSLRYSLVSRSLSRNVTDRPQSYEFDGQSVIGTPDDAADDEPGASEKRIRRVFTNTVAIRNRLQ